MEVDRHIMMLGIVTMPSSVAILGDILEPKIGDTSTSLLFNLIAGYYVVINSSQYK